MIESKNERQRRRCARERFDWNEIESLGELHGLIAHDGYAASFQDMGHYRSALVRHMGNVLRKLAAGQSNVRAWRERMGKPADWPLHAPTDVERAMVAEIAELRAQQGAAPRTDLSKRIRAAATADVTLAQAKLLIGAAEEIERAAQLDGGHGEQP
jgi:hypothetical protein